jgi:hypothetical protein
MSWQHIGRNELSWLLSFGGLDSDARSLPFSSNRPSDCPFLNTDLPVPVKQAQPRIAV